MNELDRFQQLVIAARGERVPPIDVTAGVLADIRSTVARRGNHAPLVLISSLSVLAASITAAVAAQMWLELVDPLSVFFDSLTMVMQ
jgi:hypothetical protein